MNPAEATTRLCLQCGLCCNGVLFSDVELQPGDDPRRLAALGLRPTIVRPARGPRRFPQPCTALCADNRCQLYMERPARCRDFECGVLKQVLSRDLPVDAALRVVRQTRKLADRVLELLRQLGDVAEQLPLSTRFRRTRRRMESGRATPESAEIFGELTLTVHELNLLTHERFYTRATRD